jgi:hypothetical protein
LRNLVEWNPTVRVATGGGWVDGTEALDQLGTLDLSIGGITRLLGKTGRPSNMRSRKPVETSDTKPSVEEDVFNRPQTANGLASDASALHIALKAKGFSPGASEVAGWSPALKVSAAMWVLGKLEEKPEHCFAAREAVAPKCNEENLSELCSALESRGVKVTLVQLASWPADHRAAAREWCTGKIERPAFLVVGNTESKPTVVEVTVTWGEEKFTLVPGSFSTCTVGPYSEKTVCRSGESPEQAHERVYSSLEKRAESDRAKKLASFRKILIETGAIKGDR